MELDDTASLPIGCSNAGAEFVVNVESFPTVVQHGLTRMARILGRSPE
jgi:hypothetical protein